MVLYNSFFFQITLMKNVYVLDKDTTKNLGDLGNSEESGEIEDVHLMINKIKCLPKEDQLKIYYKCKNNNIPTRKNNKNIEILVSDITPEILTFIHTIQKRRMLNTNSKSKTFKAREFPLGSKGVRGFLHNRHNQSP